MAEYIDREALRDALYDADAILMSGIKILNQFPAADVEVGGRLRGVTYEDGKVTEVHIRDTDDVVKIFKPERHGRWIPLGQRTYGTGRCPTHYCSVCGGHGWDDYPGCPYCFAKMDGGAGV